MQNKVVTVTLGEGYYTTAQSGEFLWHADLPEADGGTDKAPTPEELVMGTLGSCMAQTAKLYASRKGWQVDLIEIKLVFERFNGKDYAEYNGEAAFVHEVREQIRLEGDLDDEQKKRILEIMGKCPIRRLLANPVFFKEMSPEVLGE